MDELDGNCRRLIGYGDCMIFLLTILPNIDFKEIKN